MKTCQNCRCIYADDYAGKCSDCGAEMGNQVGGSRPAPDLSFAFARQGAQSLQETQQEAAMKRGNYDGVKLERSILEVAKGFVSVDREKYVKAGGDLADLEG